MSTPIKVQIFRSATLRQIVARILDPTTGLVIPSQPQFRASLGDLANATQVDEEHAIEAIFRCIHFPDATTGAKMRCWAWCTIAESDATPLAGQPTEEDLYLGGGSGGPAGASLFTLDSIQGEYEVCEKYPYGVTAVAIGNGGTNFVVGDIITAVGGTGTAAIFTVTTIGSSPWPGTVTGLVVANPGSYTVKPTLLQSPPAGGSGTGLSISLTFGTTNIAKPQEMRWYSPSWTELIEGVSITYTYATRAGNVDGQRSASSTPAQIEIICPIYHIAGSSGDTVSSWIYADQPVSGTDVIVSGQALIWMDTNRAGRRWVQVA